MTTPPKVTRYHLDRDGRGEKPAQPAAPGSSPLTGSPFTQPGIRVALRKKSDLEAPGNAPTRPVSATPHPPSPADRESLMSSGPVDDGFGDMRFPTAGPRPTDAPSGTAQSGKAQADTTRPDSAQAEGSSPAVSAGKTAGQDADLDQQIAAIKAENLTDRQLRIARRIAALHQIEVGSDEEAVLRLRERGIDPSHRTAVGRILSTEGARAQAAPAANTPVVMRRDPLPPAPRGTSMPAIPTPSPALPSREDMTEERRAAEIYNIQRDIARRRRRRLMMVMLRLTFFVFLPTLVAGWYYFTVATPLYATKSQFQIQQANSGGGSDLGGLFSGTQLATNPDSVAVQSYLTSRDAMLRLDGDLGFKRAFQDPAIDPIQRLAPDATNEAAYRVYEKSVKIGYDPTEGMINMEVIAPDPQLSQDFSLALIEYAEGQVDQMTARLRDDQMKGAMESYAEAETKVQEAQRRVQDLQQKLGVLDPVAEGGVVMQQVTQLEIELNNKQLELGTLKANPRPQQSRVTTLEGEISRLQDMIANTRLQLTEGNDTRASLATISGELRIAEGDLLTRQELLAAAATLLETSRVEANKQVRYLSMSVAPIPPDEASYPKAFQNTLVAFLIFAGIYLMLSLTASILREQVSS